MTECGAEHPESGQHQHNHPGAPREHGHGVTASSDSRYIAIALGLIVSFLLRETGRILLEAAPEGYAPSGIITAITSQPGVASVHDVHVWLITSGFPALSAHVLVRRPADCHQARRELEQLRCGRFGLDHTTLQVDHAPDDLMTIGDGTR